MTVTIRQLGKHFFGEVSGVDLRKPLTPQEEKLLATVAKRSIVGTGTQVRERLTALAAAHGADELVVLTITYDYASRLRSYELLAEAFGLT